MKARLILLLTSMITLLAACQTQTGDPRQGGFWGWNEDMAKQRQSELNQQATISQSDSLVEWNNNKKLREQKHAQAEEYRLLNARLVEIDAENAAIEKQIGELKQRADVKKQSKAELSKRLDGLNVKLAACKKAIQDSKTANATPNKVRISQMMDELEAEQRKLQQAFLLNR